MTDGVTDAAAASQPITPVVHTVVDLRDAIARWRAEHPGKKLALVPTMGALHEGHLQLVDYAFTRADAVVVSVFVNPTQFAPGEDFERYPRTLDRDRAACASRGVTWIFAPTAREMYPEGDQTRVTVPELAAGLCGRSRPHFFGGVARVVLKLLNIAGADVAVFGEKDYQQLQVIKRMARDLHHRTAILGAPTVRAADGLAMSSRNRYLSPSARRRAAELYAALNDVASAVARGGETTDLSAAMAHARRRIEATGARIDYLEVVDAEDLSPVTRVERPCRLLVAAWLDGTRLIDNTALVPPPG